jgi:glycine/D-amino acid oxidase-like deaminating enzyme
VVTKSKDLRTGRPVWRNGRAPSVPHRPLTRDIKTDVLIIGAGITGAMIADALCTAGRKVVLADTRGPTQGSTSASTALVQYEIDTPLTVLAGKIGKRNAVRAWRRSRLAVDAHAGGAAARRRRAGRKARSRTKSAWSVSGSSRRGRFKDLDELNA